MDFEHSGVSAEEIQQQIVHMPYLLTQHVKADAGIRFFETREEAAPLRGLLHIFQERVTRLDESTKYQITHALAVLLCALVATDKGD